MPDFSSSSGFRNHFTDGEGDGDMAKRLDLTGQRYGHLVAIGVSDTQGKRSDGIWWDFKCDCGNIISLPAGRVRSGNSNSCGCMARIAHNRIKLNPGDRYGRWTVIRYDDSRKGNYWFCKCDCGVERSVTATNLVRGLSMSCGCYNRECLIKLSTTHGIPPSHPLYSVWGNMKDRCTNPHNKTYEYYGGRGIHVCDEWMHDFKAFYDWSMANGWAKGLQIDRIDNDKGYSPDNCRWVTRIENCNNRRDNHFIEYNGERHTMSEWGRITGLGRSIIKSRLMRGWSVDDALSRPKQERNLK